MPDLSDFDKLLDNLDRLTDEQKAILLSRLSGEDNEKDRIDKRQGLLKNDSGEIISCPHCGSVSVKKHGTKDDSVCIITGTDRSKNLYIKPTCIGKLGSKHVAEHFENRFEDDAIIVTDSSPCYDKFANDSHLHHEYIPSGEHTNGPYSLSRVNAVHSKLSSYYSEDKRNLPATKHLTVGVDFFWWLEKNKDKDLQEKIDELFQMLVDNGLELTYDGIVHRKLTIDTKGLIPNKV